MKKLFLFVCLGAFPNMLMLSNTALEAKKEKELRCAQTTSYSNKIKASVN